MSKQIKIARYNRPSRIYPTHPDPEMNKEYTMEGALNRLKTIIKYNKNKSQKHHTT